MEFNTMSSSTTLHVEKAPYAFAMGLLDDLAGKAFDEAAATHRGRRNRRESARDLLVAELRAYSEKIERMRITLIDLVESLQRGAALTKAMADPAETALIAVANEGRPTREIEDACSDLLADAPFDRNEWTAVNVFLQDQMQTRLLGSSYAKAVMLAERSQAECEELNSAWARVRPLLDDLVEVKIVIAIRAHRHDLRSRLDYAMQGISDLSSLPVSSPAYDARRSRVIDVITDVIRFADGWNATIGQVRGRAGRLRSRR